MLCWNVYIGNFNSGKIEIYNIFDHWAFYDDCVKAKRKYKDNKEGFSVEVRKSLHYYFWAKCEWEIILDHWPNGEWSDLRTSMTVADMLRMYDTAGNKKDSWRINDKVMDMKVTLEVYPEWIKYEQRKIDVSEQVENNWDIFIDYLWDHRKELKARK